MLSICLGIVVCPVAVFLLARLSARTTNFPVMSVVSDGSTLSSPRLMTCERHPFLSAKETGTTVLLQLRARVPRWGARESVCVLSRGVRVGLTSPLGSRRLIDASTGKAVRVVAPPLPLAGPMGPLG